MKLILVGPTDEGFWHLENEHGMTWQIVERWADHPGAAALFGWSAHVGATDDDLAESAREFLMDHIGDQIEAPRHIADHFEEMEREAVEEVVTEFFGVKLRSTFEAVEVDEGKVGFRIEGPEIEVEGDTE